ncbi:unnamed protein product [Allacma fusca]|uniref:VWFA domain-containing protein n=1 Tax=Allacma fusca TaxID=39272 RepID=A0A8J2JV20_9HEXA|nr:unnamed protein product [Allacma fusca]
MTKVSVSASKPSLYILLDNGLADNNDAGVLNQVIPILGNFFNDFDTTGDHKELIVGVGEFPTEETQQYLKPLVPLGFLSENKAHVVNAIGNRKVINNANQDFGIALQQAAGIIKASSPVDGGNILFVKTSGAKNTTLFSTEKEIELALRRDNIKLFTLEIVDVEKTRQNLGNLAMATQGDPIAFSRMEIPHIPLVVPTWLEFKVLAEYSTPPLPNQLERITYSSFVQPNTGWNLNEAAANTTAVTTLSASTLFIPPSQDFEAFEPVPFPSGANKFTTLESSIQVTNAANFVPSIQTIRDLTVSVAESNPAQVTLEFTNPRVLQLGNTGNGNNNFPTLERCDARPLGW